MQTAARHSGGRIVIMAKPKHIHHRFKIQRRVNVTARDRSNKKFLFATQWRTVAEADHKPVAENILRDVKHDQPRKVFRVAEVWPADAEPRVVVSPR